MKNFTSVIGWLLMAVVLTVPSFLFYNWWTGTKNEATVQIPAHSGSTATIFYDARDRSAVQPVVQASTAAGVSVFQAASVRRTDQSSVIAPVSTAVPMAAAGIQRVAWSTAAAQGGGASLTPVSTRTAGGSSFNPKYDHDPTMSPGDYQRVREAEQAKLESERRLQLALRKQQYDAGGEGRIRLQGIVGNRVIINGEAYSVGDIVTGVKILKIGSNYLIGEYKGNKFRKILK